MDILIPSFYCQVFVLWRERGGNVNLGCSARKFECNCCAHIEEIIFWRSACLERRVKTSWLKKDTVVCHCSSLPFDTNKYTVHVVTAKILLTCTLLNVHCKDSALSTSTEYTHWKHFLIKTLCAWNTLMVFQIPITVVIKLNAINVILNSLHNGMPFQIHMNPDEWI